MNNNWGTKRRTNEQKSLGYDYTKIVEAKSVCDTIIHDTGTMEGFIRNLNECPIDNELLKYVFHVASCGTFVDGVFFMPSTKMCIDILNLVGFRSTLEDVYTVNGYPKSTIFEYGIGFITQ